MLLITPLGILSSGGKLVHICTIRRYKLVKKSKRSDWWRQVGSEGRNGKIRVCAFWQCAGWWVCDACNKVHECMSTVNILKSRGIFPAAKTSLTWVKQMHIWLTSTTCAPTKIYTHSLTGVVRGSHEPCRRVFSSLDLISDHFGKIVEMLFFVLNSEHVFCGENSIIRNFWIWPCTCIFPSSTHARPSICTCHNPIICPQSIFLLT